MTKELNKIAIHWTAGNRIPNKLELEHYHYLVDINGKVYEGNYKPEDNIDCKDGKYAQHCGGGNTGCIGIAMCGMMRYNDTTRCSNSDLSLQQIQATCKLIADVCKKYNIKISPKTVFTHAEFGIANPKTSSAGKIDIIYLPPIKLHGIDNVGKYLRNKVQWYLDKENK